MLFRSQTSHCPGATSFVQDSIRKEVKKNGLYIIDLPSEFNAYLNGKVPNRLLFLDYCHLTVEGINIAMYHVAKEIYSVIKGQTLPVNESDVQKFGPDSLSNAVAHFLAAIHNAHWGQDFDIIYYHCSKSLSYFDIANEMLLYVYTTISTSCPWRLNKYFEALIEGGIFSQYLLLFQPEEGYESFDLILTDAVFQVLEENGNCVTEEVNNMRLNEVATAEKIVNILKSYYWTDFNNMSIKYKKGSYFKEFNHFSKFYLVCDATCEIKLELVHRLPYISDANDLLEVEINGKRFHSSCTSDKWKKQVISVSKELLVKGINTIKIYWPLKNVKTRYNSVVQYADIDLLHKYMYPVIGEIHSFTMTYHIADVDLIDIAM